MAVPYRWPQNAKAAIALTLDNMGEAADLNRGVWPEGQPIGKHYSVTEALPKVLALLKKYDIYVTYFIEAWNLTQYPTVVATQVAAAGHEVAWHGWQHENWGRLRDEADEKAIFEKSFGDQGLTGFTTGSGKGRGKMLPYRGFRPPGGLIQGNRTLSLCREYGLGYISPAAENASIEDTSRGKPDSIVVLPFRWRNVDAYYYMDSFSGLRKLKGEQKAPLSEDVLVQRYIAEIDKAIKEETFLSLLFHPFLTNTGPRLDAMEAVVKYLAEKRSQGVIWIARCRDIEHHVRRYPRSASERADYDTSEWR